MKVKDLSKCFGPWAQYGLAGWALTFALPGQAATTNVYVENFDFNPPAVAIKVHDQVHWIWSSGFHNSTSDPGDTTMWSSGDMSAPGGSFTFAFPNAGTFPYTCTIHSFHGSVKVEAGNTTPWPDATDLGGGERRSSWFGDFNVTYYPWIYHAQHGWMYVFGTDPASIWLWTTDMGFLWTGSGVYPWLWRNQDHTWLYYVKGSHSPRFFFNWNTQQWEMHNP